MSEEVLVSEDGHVWTTVVGVHSSSSFTFLTEFFPFEVYEKETKTGIQTSDKSQILPIIRLSTGGEASRVDIQLVLQLPRTSTIQEQRRETHTEDFLRDFNSQ